VNEVVVRGEKFIKSALGFREQRAADLKFRILMKNRRSRAGVEANLAHVGMIEAGEDVQQRRLARAVGTHQADAVAGLQLEADLVEERISMESAGKTSAAK
jgi:hypothetical protein